jgi:hypothetical protein
VRRSFGSIFSQSTTRQLSEVAELGEITTTNVSSWQNLNKIDVHENDRPRDHRELGSCADSAQTPHYDIRHRLCDAVEYSIPGPCRIGSVWPLLVNVIKNELRVGNRVSNTANFAGLGLSELSSLRFLARNSVALARPRLANLALDGRLP